jgi:hypothetical protein
MFTLFLLLLRYDMVAGGIGRAHNQVRRERLVNKCLSYATALAITLSSVAAVGQIDPRPKEDQLWFFYNVQIDLQACNDRLGDDFPVDLAALASKLKAVLSNYEKQFSEDELNKVRSTISDDYRRKAAFNMKHWDYNAAVAHCQSVVDGINYPPNGLLPSP